MVLSRGQDGALYIGELLGGQYAPGHARIWRAVPDLAPKVWSTGRPPCMAAASAGTACFT